MDTNGHEFTWGNERIEHRRKEGAGTDSQKPTRQRSGLDLQIQMPKPRGPRKSRVPKRGPEWFTKGNEVNEGERGLQNPNAEPRNANGFDPPRRRKSLRADPRRLGHGKSR